MINQVVQQRYEVLEKVGDSPLFVVYKARDKSANRMVALKALTPKYAADTAFREGLRSGLYACAGLVNPGITTFYEFVEEPDHVYFLTEFVRGINLKERIRRIAPFTLSVAVDFACALGDALHYAHTIGQTHGDLRPHNVGVSPEGLVKITDFGVQRGIVRSEQAQHDILLRSASYRAPELDISQPGTIGGDIYALGVVLFEMLTGTPLYSGESPDAIADQHAYSAIPLPRTINAGVPRSVEGIILLSLQKKPEARYRSVADVLTDLKAVRDALRFGKPLSWTPVDIEKLAAAPPRPVAAVPKPKPVPKPVTAPVAASALPEPVADVTASSEVIPMPSKRNRLRAQDERISVYLRGAIVAVTTVIIGAVVAMAGIYFSNWAVPKANPMPSLVGQKIEYVRAAASKANFRLSEHPEYTEKPRGIVLRTDRDVTEKIRPNQTVNVWYSLGPAFVNVPKVVGLNREEAEKKLTEAGLKIGRVEKKNNDKIAQDIVMSQSETVRALHDTPVNLVVSDGPKVEAVEPNQNDPNAVADNAVAGDDNEVHTFDRVISVEKVGTRRRVRIEYEDALGTHPPVVNEEHDPGDRIPVQFSYYGKTIILRIYYDDILKKEFPSFDPQKTRNQHME